MNEEEAELARLERVAEALPDGVLAGCLVSFPVGDGMATYIVKSEKPLVL
jgi:hypothetical protein